MASRERVDWGQVRREPRRWFLEVLAACGIFGVCYLLGTVIDPTILLIAAVPVGLAIGFVLRRRAQLEIARQQRKNSRG